MGHIIERLALGPLSIEFGEGGEHASAKLYAGKSSARGSADLFDRRFLGALCAWLPRFQIGRARDDDRLERQARATNGFGDRRQRSGGVPLVGDDDFEDDPSGNRLRDLSISFELGEPPPVARIDVADKKVWIESAQGVRGGERRLRLFRG